VTTTALNDNTTAYEELEPDALTTLSVVLVGEHPAVSLYHVRQTAATVCTAQIAQILNGKVDKWMDGRLDGWKVGWKLDGRLDGWKVGWMEVGWKV
jgi:hypothetical protein